MTGGKCRIQVNKEEALKPPVAWKTGMDETAFGLAGGDIEIQSWAVIVQK